MNLTATLPIVLMISAGVGLTAAWVTRQVLVRPIPAFALAMLAVACLMLAPYFKRTEFFETALRCAFYFFTAFSAVYSFRARLQTTSLLLRLVLYFLSAFLWVALSWVVFIALLP